MDQHFNVYDWYWYVGGDETKVFSSRPDRRNYVPTTDPAFVTWLLFPGNIPTRISSEAELGNALAQFRLRPIPPGMVDAYLDELTEQIVREPEFVLWIDVYRTALNRPEMTPAQVKQRVRRKLHG